MPGETFASSRIAAYPNWKPGALLFKHAKVPCVHWFRSHTSFRPHTCRERDTRTCVRTRILHHSQRGLISYSALSHSCLLWTILVGIDLVRNSAEDRGMRKKRGEGGGGRGQTGKRKRDFPRCPLHSPATLTATAF